MPEGVTKEQLEQLEKPRSATLTIYKLVRFHEATNNPFFLEKIHIILKYIKEGNTSDIAIENDLPNDVLLCMVFALSDEPLTEDEAKGLSALMLADKNLNSKLSVFNTIDIFKTFGDKLLKNAGVSSYGEFLFNINSIMSLKKGLLATKGYLFPGKTQSFLTAGCGRILHIDGNAAAAETLKFINDRDNSRSIAAKAWLSNPQTEVDFNIELASKKVLLRQYEDDLQVMSDAMKAGLDMKVDLRAKLLAIELLNMALGDLLDRIRNKMYGLVDDIEDLQQLGITTKTN
ncbi:uncharacterized protein PAC_15973 [Phialocephala subalpina]|uniref:Uncharacterized protein n=1 Tax=Phialocephala subalpina TaxID=576137 RepID=A0A1L7XM12_9HELO|nr:uncharacterized protein PAC_15973 [Phialocephala subalpina]